MDRKDGAGLLHLVLPSTRNRAEELPFPPWEGRVREGKPRSGGFAVLVHGWEKNGGETYVTALSVPGFLWSDYR